MDYTTVDRVKSEAIKTDLDTDNDLLELLVTGASRAIDRKVTGAAFNLGRTRPVPINWPTTSGRGR